MSKDKESSAQPEDGQPFEKIVTRLESIAQRLEQGDDAEHRLEVLLGDGQTESFASEAE